MENDSWNKIQTIVYNALQLNASERQAFIEKECADSDELLSEIQSLLENEKDVDKYFESPYLRDYAGLSEDEEPGNYADKSIGNFKTIREIGYGGMGAVYLAARSDGKFEQQVAVKLLKRELNTTALRSRFRHERKVLASLEHPNIAHLIDAGTTEDGIPYIVMEYVDGVPIDIYCEKNRLDLDERLELFRTVCGAVDFAHRNLIVHRDIKPSNILVNKDGVPKLLDFGIAKILSPDPTGQETLTQFGAMTPSYASPEQLQRDRVSTSTDIYSLGVVLYEILSGQRPFEQDEMDFKKMYKAVCETNPPLPSIAAGTVSVSLRDENEITAENMGLDTPVSTNNGSATDLSFVENTNPRSPVIRPKNLRGDIDNIILKALQRDPQRRYSSAENFGEDIRRHQIGLPVHARPDTFSYRAVKYIKRNRLAATSAFLLVAAIFIGLFATLWQASVAQAEKARAEKRFNDVRTLANSFLFEITPEIEKLPGSTRAKEIVVKRALEYLDSLNLEVDDDNSLKEELAAAYEKVGDVQGNPYKDNIGDLAGALKSYQKSREILEQLYKETPDSLALKKKLSRNYGLIGDVFFYEENSKSAEEYFNKAIDLNAEVIAADPKDTEVQAAQGELFNALGLIPFWGGENKKALELYDRALNIFVGLNKKQPENLEFAASVANTKVRMGEVWQWEDETIKGNNLIQEGIDSFKQINAKDPTNKKNRRSLMLAYFRLGEGYAEIKNFEKSLSLYRESLEIAALAENEDKANKKAKRDHITIKFHYSETLDMAGKNLEGLKSLEEVLSLRRELAKSDPTNPTHAMDIATTLNSIGETQFNLKRYEPALQSFQSSLKGFENTKEVESGEDGRGKRGVGIACLNLGKTYMKIAGSQKVNQKSALAYFRRALAILGAQNAEGKLTEFDKPLLTEAEKAIKELSGD